MSHNFFSDLDFSVTSTVFPSISHIFRRFFNPLTQFWVLQIAHELQKTRLLHCSFCPDFRNVDLQNVLLQQHLRITLRSLSCLQRFKNQTDKMLPVFIQDLFPPPALVPCLMVENSHILENNCLTDGKMITLVLQLHIHTQLKGCCVFYLVMSIHLLQIKLTLQRPRTRPSKSCCSYSRS